LEYLFLVFNPAGNDEAAGSLARRNLSDLTLIGNVEELLPGLGRWAIMVNRWARRSGRAFMAEKGAPFSDRLHFVAYSSCGIGPWPN